MEDYFKIPGQHNQLPDRHKPHFSGACPHCGQQALFEPLMPNDALGFIQEWSPPNSSQRIMGDAKVLQTNVFAMRRCPAPACKGIVFIVAQQDRSDRTTTHYQVKRLFPEPVIEIDTEGLPEMIVSLLTEAIGCYQHGFYRSSATMIRRVLEEICREFGAQGSVLHDQIIDLPNRVLIDPTQHDALKNLKLLGNDGAHKDLRTFSKLDQEELDIALELIQILLHTWFKHRHLNAKLERHKRNSSAPPP